MAGQNRDSRAAGRGERETRLPVSREPGGRREPRHRLQRRAEILAALRRQTAAVMGGDPHPARADVSVCVGCGCTDDAACLGGCWWRACDRQARLGVCSRCARTREEAVEWLQAELAHRAAETGDAPPALETDTWHEGDRLVVEDAARA